MEIEKAGIKTFIGTVLSTLILLVVGVFIFFFFQVTVAPNPDGLAASGNFSFNGGNVSQNETVNITAGGVVYAFMYNLSSFNWSIPSGYIYVNLSSASNNSAAAASNLTVAINNNATLAGFVTASNSTNATVLTYDVVGKIGNYIATTDTVANGSWANPTLTGGTDIVRGMSATISITLVLAAAMGLLVLITAFVFLMKYVKQI